MRYFPLVLGALLAACNGSGRRPQRYEEPPRPTAKQKEIQAEVEVSFRAFIDSMVAGDADAGYLMMSDSFKSEWLYTMMTADDGFLRRWRRSLTGNPRTDLDLWYGFCKKHRRRMARAEVLPGTVLVLPSLRKLWADYFNIDRLALKYQMQKTAIEKVDVDGTGVTVRVRNGQGRLELYQMVLEQGLWKVDHHSAGSAY